MPRNGIDCLSAEVHILFKRRDADVGRSVFPLTPQFRSFDDLQLMKLYGVNRELP
jgi:hypothetical protein